MKVICIDDSGIPPCGSCSGFFNLVKVQEIYETVGEYNNSYLIKNKQRCDCGQRQSFKKYRFIPLSEIDETELVNKKQDVCV